MNRSAVVAVFQNVCKDVGATLTFPDGKSHVPDLKGGQALWLEAV
jgi:hypothetical protein